MGQLTKILISRCFLGEKVKYNGGDNKLFHEIISKWKSEGRLVPICPEVSGGLPVPRPAAELQPSGEVYTEQGDNVSVAFRKGAEIALDLCKSYKIRFALLKESSPSCGSETIYDGAFMGRKIYSEGVTTALLRVHGISVYSENNIDQLIRDIDNQLGKAMES